MRASLKLLHNTNKNILSNSISGMPVIEASIKLYFINTSVSGSEPETIVQCLVCHSISFSDLTCFMVENVLLHTHLLPNIEYIFCAKSFSLGNLSLLTNFPKLYTVRSSDS